MYNNIKLLEEFKQGLDELLNEGTNNSEDEIKELTDFTEDIDLEDELFSESCKKKKTCKKVIKEEDDDLIDDDMDEGVVQEATNINKKLISELAKELDEEDEEEDFDGDGEDDIDPDELENLHLGVTDEEIKELSEEDLEDEVLQENTELISFVESLELGEDSEDIISFVESLELEI